MNSPGIRISVGSAFGDGEWAQFADISHVGVDVCLNPAALALARM